MDAPSGNHLQTADDEEDQFEVFQDSAAFQEPAQGGFYSNYCQGGRPVDVPPKWHGLMVSADAISSELIMQEGFSLSSPNVKTKRRKSATEKIEAHHGSRIIRSGGGRRDRHSKVCTARGTRDRRVRLSPKTAIQFYDVQDRLGYDRPSKAIDWLMKEAKAAIDALDESPSRACIAAGNHGSPNGEFSKTPRESECGRIIESLDHLNGDIRDSSFGFFTAPLSSNELPAHANEDSMLHHDGFLPSIPTELLDPNLEMIRLQRIFHFPGSPFSGGSQMFCEREPLQSSITTNNSQINLRFSGFRLPNEEIPNFAAAAATLTEDERIKIPASTKPSTTSSSFLHYQV